MRLMEKEKKKEEEKKKKKEIKRNLQNIGGYFAAAGAYFIFKNNPDYFWAFLAFLITGGG